jgi:ATP-dependent Lon protease
LATIPIGQYHTLPITNKDDDIARYLQNIKRTIDNNIFGHEETKDQIVRILAQWISNPNSNGYVIGIQGSPGVGKTKLIKEGICKAMEYPFSFVSLGGISDASYLNGHHYTYEGATHGKIIECLVKARVMNPVFLFDELDKVSNTSRGEEIINTLIHITDPVQNDKFTDKYFEEIDLDLSKSLIIFTYNDENAINPVLKDRMITIKVNGYNAKEKLIICKDYILPELLPQYNMKTGDVIIDDSLLKNIIDTHGKEEGVRNLKRILNNILSSINMMKYIPTDGVQIVYPFQVDVEFFNKYCSKFETKRSDIVWSMYT